MKNLAANIADKVLGKDTTATPSQPKYDESRLQKCLCWQGNNNIKYEDKPVPIVTDPHDVVLRITSTTICGSDLHLYHGGIAMKPGDIMGHEFMGIIEEKGEMVLDFNVGDRVVVAFDIACGQCQFCQREEFTACDVANPSRLGEKAWGDKAPSIFGYSHITGGIPGGQAEYVRVPFADVNCLKIPEEVTDEQALFLTDVVPTAYHGTELGSVGEQDTVGIWGLGPIGLMTARWCQIRKAKRIIGIDCIPERLKLAQSLGIETINFKEQKVYDTIRAMCPYGVDVAIECAGFDYPKTMTHKVEMAVGLETDTSDIISEMFACVRKFGRVSIIGVYMGFANHFPVGAMMEKDLTVRCGQSPTQKYWRMCLEKIMNKELDPTFIITHRSTLADGPNLYKKFDNKDGVIKVFLRPEHIKTP